ncbi:family 20 glycosylhydrolase [Mobiluncus mulieris]|nr:family 20 glycosylhydrolase [Mobiluncus mulieris]
MDCKNIGNPDWLPVQLKGKKQMAPHENENVKKGALTSRGVTLCAGQVGISLGFMRRLLQRMQQLGFSELVWEMKMQSARYPAANTWHYYTVSEVKQVLQWASELGIQVIPEINTPGHMGVWLENYPHLALQRKDGSTGDCERLDLTNPRAVEFYLNLVDEYLEVFTPKYTKYWHMGADEYMIHDSYDNYPQILDYARQTYGENATPYDVFNGFINQVNAHVRAKGYNLRIWNDGIHDSPVVSVDNNIVVEYWKDEGLRVAELARRGHKLINATEKLYWSRSHAPYRVDAKALWESTWDGREFIGGQRLNPALAEAQLGLRVSIWPDTSYYQTEHEVWTAIQDSLLLVAALDGNGEKANVTWEEAHRRATVSVWPEPGVPEGIYRIAQLGSVAPGPWRVGWTQDQYVTLTDLASGQNLALCSGGKHLEVVTESGATVELCEPVEDASWPTGWDTAEARNTQKWVLTPVQTGHELRGELGIQTGDGRCSEEERQPEEVGIKELAPHEDEKPKATKLTCIISPALTNQQLCVQGDIVAQYPPDAAPSGAVFQLEPIFRLD